MSHRLFTTLLLAADRQMVKRIRLYSSTPPFLQYLRNLHPLHFLTHAHARIK